MTEFYTEEEMAKMLRIDVKTLRSRRSRGTNHPPYVVMGKKQVLYPKNLYLKWATTLPIFWEVRHVG